MRAVLAGVLGSGLVLASACGSESARRGPLPEPEVDAVAPASSDEGAGQRVPATEGLSGPFAALGSACPETAAEGQRCAGERVVAVYANAYGFGHRSTRAALLHERHANDTKRAGIDVYWDSGVVWLRVLECGSCATLVGWTFAGVPDAMDEGQLQELIRKLGLPSNTPLRSRADWEEAGWATAFQVLVSGSSSSTPAPAAPPPKKPEAPPASDKPAGAKPAGGEGTYD